MERRRYFSSCRTKFGEKIFESLVQTITLCVDNLDQRETRKVLFVSDVFTVMTDGIICKLTRSDIEEARTFLLLRFGIHTLVTNNRTETLKNVFDLVRAVGRRPYRTHKSKVKVNRSVMNKKLIESRRQMNEIQVRKVNYGVRTVVIKSPS